MSLSGKVGGNLLARTASKIAGRDPGWAERKTAQQLVATLGTMKGLAQKVGQALSMDLDHVPAEMREIISSLQSKSQPMDYPAIAQVVEEELGAPPEALFAHFERSPLAAASLGQVHRAVLKDGRQAAVKVQYPGAAGAIQADLKNIDALLKAVGGVMGGVGKAFKGQGYFDEVATELGLETDYRREASHCREFAELLRPFPELQVPQVYGDLCAGRVLTLEFLDGEPLAAVIKRGAAETNARRFEISTRLIAALYGPLLSSGMVHADPHPGNFLVMPDGRLGILDFGSVKRESDAMLLGHREAYRALLDGVEPDYLPLLRSQGFDVDAAPDEVRQLFSAFFQLLRQPLLDAAFDFGQTTLAAQFEALTRKNVKTLMKIRPPAEGLMFFRAFGGQSQNLRALGAVGNFREVYASIFERGLAADRRTVTAA